MLRASIMLATIPVIVFAITGVGKSNAPIAQKPVATEGITARRIDDNTFRRRWAPLQDVPPATEVRYVRNATPEGSAIVASAVSEAAVSPPALRPSRHRLFMRTKPARLDVCQRHNMHKMMVGKYRWRCRR